MNVIDRRPVEAPFAGRILTSRTNLVGVVCEAAPAVLGLVGTFTAILAYQFGFGVEPPAGARPALSPAVASLLIGLGIALFAFSLYWTIRSSWVLFDWYVRRVARRQIVSRPDRLGDPHDPQAAFVEIVRREELIRGMQEEPDDVGFLWIDAARGEVLFEGDRERIRIPAAGILTCCVFKAPIRVDPLVFQKFFFVVTCAHPTDLIQISFAHRDGLGVLGAARRRQRAMATCERIRSLIASQAPAPAADTERTTPPKQ
jgi:hypothetical protein